MSQRIVKYTKVREEFEKQADKCMEGTIEVETIEATMADFEFDKE